MNDGEDNMGENRGENRYDDCEYDDNSPEAKYIGGIETATLDHLKNPD
jgi:hypothetical protein